MNSTGGINGRKLVVSDSDDQFTGATNKQATQNAINNDFAMLGNFSLEDSFGGALLKANPGMPDVSVVLDTTTNKLPNVYSAVPLNGGWEEGPLQYFKKKFPKTLKHAASMVAGLPSAETDWAGEKYVLNKVGFKVIYEPTYTVSTTDFTQNVIAMKNMGVKILFVDPMAASYASSLLKDLNQQNFHPVVILGAATYTNTLVARLRRPGGRQRRLPPAERLALPRPGRQDPPGGGHLPQVGPGGVAGLQAGPVHALRLAARASSSAQALKNAGTNPSRGSLLQALSKITSFDGNHIIAPNNPAAKTIGNCYLIGRVVNGTVRGASDDPPASSSTNGYRCDYSYVTPPS